MVHVNTLLHKVNLQTHSAALSQFPPSTWKSVWPPQVPRSRAWPDVGLEKARWWWQAKRIVIAMTDHHDDRDDEDDGDGDGDDADDDDDEI